MSDAKLESKLTVADDGLWCVCWLAEFECDGEHQPFVTRRGEPCIKTEAERRVEWGRKESPWIIYWIEPA